ncbi:MAG: thioredoxin [Burkholderiaceae bacterium]|nr:MAG: thioredoxin [Burkholderiaceae bacterium]
MFNAPSLFEFRQALARQAHPVVVALCAQWCGTCREFRASFEALELEFPQALFFWLDVEDDAILTGDIDIQDFPSLALYGAAGEILYFGTTLPQHGVVARLLATRLGHPAPQSQTTTDAKTLRLALIGAHFGA